MSKSTASAVNLDTLMGFSEVGETTAIVVIGLTERGARGS
jgi:hypothetical protein